MFEPEPATAQSNFAAPSPVAAPAAESVYPFRLLSDETVLGTYPVAQKRRPFGKVVSYLFVTDSRVIYSAEAKTFASSSIHSKEYQVQTVQGIEVGRHRGLNALGVSAAIGVVLNFLGTLILAGLAGAAAANFSQATYGIGPDLTGLTPLFGFLSVASLIVGAVVILVLRRPTASLKIVGPNEPQVLARETDFLKWIITFILFLIFGLFIGFAVIIWVLIRELGVFEAEDAQLYAEPENMDQISHSAGALIIDVQARGKFAGQG